MLALLTTTLRALHLIRVPNIRRRHHKAQHQSTRATMASTDSQLNLQTCRFQDQSQLFGVIPGEIRNKIFAYALVQYEDDAAAYPEDSYWYRPGFKGPKRSSSALLRTCKLAYIEGQRVYLHELEWAFWFDRGPNGRSGSQDCTSFFDNLSPQQARDLEQVRFFTQMFWLEHGRSLNQIFNHANFRPSRLTITIRYSDWWWWEHNTPLKMSQEWLRDFNGSPGLRELKVEYETLTWKKAQMDQIVARNKKWRLRVRDGGHLSADGTKLEEWTWTGPSKLDGKTWNHHGQGDTVEYVVVTDLWKFVEGPIPDDYLAWQNSTQLSAPNSDTLLLEEDDDEYSDQGDLEPEDLVLSDYSHDGSDNE